MRLPPLAIVVTHRCVQWLLIGQLITCAVTAHGQSLTIPEESSLSTPDPSSPVPTPATSIAGNTLDFVATIRTDLLAEFVNQETVRRNSVATQVLEANVRGMQTTTTSVRLISEVCQERARLNIISQGTVSSNTVGLTPQARVNTVGSHTFNVIKPVYFDGDRFLTKPAYGSLQARQFPQAVTSVASGLPLVGPLGDQIAWREVLRRMPASDAIVVRRVADDVLPTVNTAVDKNLAELNRKWQTLRRKLESLSGTDRISWNAATTADSLSLSAHNLSITSRSATTGRLSAELTGPESMVIRLSQAATNRWLERLPLAGVSVSDSALQGVVEKLQAAQNQNDPEAIKKLFNEDFDPDSEPLLFSLRFADFEPLMLEYDGGSITIRLKFQVVPKVGEPGVMQLVKVQLRGQSEEDGMWSVGISELSAEPASRNELPDLYTNLINNPAIISQIPPTRLPRTIDLRPYDPKIPLFRLHRMQCDGGLLRVSLSTND